MLRQGLRQQILSSSDLSLVGEAATGAVAVQQVKELHPDVVILDIHLPDTDGVKVIEQILAIAPRVKVLVFSSDADRALVDRTLQAGADGYVLKASAVEELIAGLEAVVNGKLYLSPAISAGILEEYRRNLAGEVETDRPVLSQRDIQLLRLISKGLRNKEMAAQLSLSPNSVETYRGRLMQKLGCSSTAELVRFAIREGIAPLEES